MLSSVISGFFSSLPQYQALSHSRQQMLKMESHIAVVLVMYGGVSGLSRSASRSPNCLLPANRKISERNNMVCFVMANILFVDRWGF